MARQMSKNGWFILFALALIALVTAFVFSQRQPAALGQATWSSTYQSNGVQIWNTETSDRPTASPSLGNLGGAVVIAQDGKYTVPPNRPWTMDSSVRFVRVTFDPSLRTERMTIATYRAGVWASSSLRGEFYVFGYPSVVAGNPEKGIEITKVTTAMYGQGGIDLKIAPSQETPDLLFQTYMLYEPPCGTPQPVRLDPNALPPEFCVDVTYANQGPVQAGHAWIEGNLLDSQGSSVRATRKEFPGLQARSGDHVMWQVRERAGKYTVVFDMDTGNEVTESDEGNNRLKIPITVLPPPCTSDADCGANSVCTGRQCVPMRLCKTDGDCPKQSTCSGADQSKGIYGKCVATKKCKQNADCAQGSVCSGAEQDGNEYGRCVAAVQCEQSATGGQYEICEPETACVSTDPRVPYGQCVRLEYG
ncbi:hypothetical protein HY642_05480 [Candidatus Woesearchaeota archaeon]|nr:hypothetical protein [Candidatus Woesearchaeota archaeon]